MSNHSLIAFCNRTEPWRITTDSAKIKAFFGNVSDPNGEVVSYKRFSEPIFGFVQSHEKAFAMVGN